MSWLKHLLSRKVYVLRARRPTGEWEDVETYNKKVGIEDVKDVIEDLKADGYDYFQLVEKGEKTKVVWSKHYRSVRKRELLGRLGEIRDLLGELNTLREYLKSLLGVSDVNPLQQFAEVVAVLNTFRNFCNEYPDLCGKTEMKPSELRELLELLRELRGMGITIPTGPPTPQQSPLPTPPPPPPPTAAANPTLRIPPESLPQDVVRKVNEMIQRGIEKASEIVTLPCEAAGVCLEGEGAGGSG